MVKSNQLNLLKKQLVEAAGVEPVFAVMITDTLKLNLMKESERWYLTIILATHNFTWVRRIIVK